MAATKKPKPHIVAAAIIDANNKMHTLPQPARHASIRTQIYAQDSVPKTEGFLTNENDFVDRGEAGEIAFAAGQTRHRIGQLTTLDLW
jgi:hypothetical protein